MIVFIIRHADRNSSTDALSPMGEKRAQRLGEMLAESGVDLGFCSEARRTHQTLAPLQERVGDAFEVTEIPVAGPGGTNAHVDGVVTAVATLAADRSAVVVSHSQTVDRIVAGLGGGMVEPIGDNEFDRLFVLITAADGSKRLLKLRY